jgi:hypothetical protein
MEHARPMLRRCAIYTRKSSEEGLEQNFNSLHRAWSARRSSAYSAMGAQLNSSPAAYPKSATFKEYFESEYFNKMSCRSFARSRSKHAPPHP